MKIDIVCFWRAERNIRVPACHLIETAEKRFRYRDRYQIFREPRGT
jgi:hypothetical protein